MFLVSIVARRLLLRTMGVAPWKSTQAGMLAGAEVDFLLLSRLAALDQLVRYGVLLGLAFAIGRWHRGRRLASYGLTRARRGWRELLMIGVVLWGVSKTLPALLLAADDHLPWIGSGPDHWALFPATWSAAFLLYTAVASFALVPIVEELAFRGYMLNRLREDYGEAGALALSSVFFALVNTQYFKAEILSAGMLVSLAIASLGAGYVLIQTGSLVPCIVAHALANLPIPPGEWSEEALLAVAVAVVVLAWRPVLRWVADLLGVFANEASWGSMALGLLLLVAALAVVFAFQSQLSGAALVLLLAGIGGNALDRRAKESRIRRQLAGRGRGRSGRAADGSRRDPPSSPRRRSRLEGSRR